MSRPAPKPRRRHASLVVLGLLACVALAVFVRWQFFVILGGLEPHYIDWAMYHYFGGITPNYVDLGDRIFSGTWPGIGAYSTGYAMLIQTIQTLGASTLQHVRIVQFVLDALAILPFFGVLRWLGVTRLFATAGAVLYAVDPLLAGGSTFVLGESINPLLFVWLLFGLTRALTPNTRWRWAVAGAIGGFATLCRSEFMLVPAAVLVLVLVAPRGTRGETRRGRVFGLCGLYGLFMAGFVAMLLPVMILNRVHNGRWTFSSTSGSYALYCGLGQVPSGAGIVISDATNYVDHIEPHGAAWGSPEAAAYWWTAYRDIARDRPGLVVRNVLHRLNRIVSTSERFPTPYLTGFRNLLDRGGLLLLIGAAAGLLVRTRRRDRLAVLVLPLGYAMLSIGLVYYDERYVRYAQLSYLMAIVVLGDLGWRWILLRTRRRSAGRAPGRARSARRRRNAMTVEMAGASIIGLALGAGLIPALASLAGDAGRTKLLFALETAVDLERGAATGFDPSSWRVRATEASVTRGDGLFDLRTSPGAFAHQLDREIPMGGADGLVVDVDLDVRRGGVRIGVLAGSTRRWIATRDFTRTGPHEETLVVATPGETSVRLVVANHEPAGTASEITIRELTATPVTLAPGAAVEVRWRPWSDSPAFQTWRSWMASDSGPYHLYHRENKTRYERSEVLPDGSAASDAR